ncbi:MAG: hypothetical protein JXB10_00230 [Pirellulales bacterium]|nr:hypothetical protein [Pirellulales bacterium]
MEMAVICLETGEQRKLEDNHHQGICPLMETIAFVRKHRWKTVTNLLAEQPSNAALPVNDLKISTSDDG